MKALITGGLGFLGRLVARQLRDRGDEVVLLDRGGEALPGTRLVVGEVTDPATVAEAVAGVDAVVHLASLVSAECELDPDAALRVNLDGLRVVLAACGARPAPPRFLFTSSVAVFGGELARGPVGDLTKQAPASVYGVTKAIGELLVNDATRRGVVDGRTARLPTVIVRPGRPNAAASGFASGVVREPLAGAAAVLPVAPETPICVIGHRAAVDGLVRLLDVDGEAIDRLDGGEGAPHAPGDRAVGLPALEVTAGGLVDAVREVARRDGRALGPIEVRPDPLVTAVVGSWPGRWRAPRAAALGLVGDASLVEVVRAYLEDFGDGAAPAR